MQGPSCRICLVGKGDEVRVFCHTPVYEFAYTVNPPSIMLAQFGLTNPASGDPLRSTRLHGIWNTDKWQPESTLRIASAVTPGQP